MTAIDRYLAHLVDVVEGPKFTDDPRDRGGATKYGITQRALASFRGRAVTVADVQALTRDEALAAYRDDYVTLPGFDKLAEISMPVAIECIDTGVNMGPQIASVLLQRGLNTLGATLRVDGACGTSTRQALQSVLRTHGELAEPILLKMLNCEQGARYISIAESDPKQKAFVFGWFRQRIQLEPNAAFYGGNA